MPGNIDILNSNIGIPAAVTTVILTESVSGSLVWLMPNVSVATTVSGISVTGGNSVVNIDGNLVAMSSAALLLGVSGSNVPTSSVVTIGAGGKIIAGNNGLVSNSGHDTITVAGEISARINGVILGSTAGTGFSDVTIAAGGVVSGTTAGINDLAGAANITVNGAVTSDATGISLNSGSSLHIGSTGSVTGLKAITATTTYANIENAGTVHGSSFGVSVASGVFVDFANTGTVQALTAFQADTGNNSFSNSGGIYGSIALLGSGSNSIVNDGLMDWQFGTASIRGVGNSLRNTGTMTGFGGLSLGDTTANLSTNVVINSGVITGHTEGLHVDNSARIINSGIISGSGIGIRDLFHTTSNTVIKNSGEITSLGTGILLSSVDGSSSLVTNLVHGLISGVSDGAGVLVLRNYGVIEGSVLMGDGSDSYIGQHGTVTLNVSGGNGNDFLLGGLEADLFEGDADNDILRGNAGDDTLDGDGGNDSVQGGAGDDSLNEAAGGGDDSYDGGAGQDVLAYTVSTSVTVNLAAGRASGVDIGTDTLTGIEAVTSGAGADLLTGDEVANALSGGAGLDTLQGDDGRDTLDGGNDADTLVGGLGRDLLTGGEGQDRFVFNALADSTVAVAGRDVITDFTDNATSALTRDRINLSAIDANATLAGDQAFVSINGNAFVAGSSGGKMHFLQVGGNTLVEMEVDNDGVADMSILILGAHTLTSVDFLL